MKEYSSIRRRLHQARVLTNYAVRHPKEFVSKSIEKYKEAKTNVSEGGMAVSTALFFISPIVPATIAPLTLFTHEILKNVPTNMVNFIALGLVGLTSLINIPLEAKALRKKGFSNSIPSSTTYLATKAENATAFLMHFYHMGVLSGLNGLSIQVLNTLMGNQGKYFASGLITTSVVLSIWNNLTLRPIINGTIDPFVNKVNNISLKVKNKTGDLLFGDPIKSLTI